MQGEEPAFPRSLKVRFVYLLPLSCVVYKHSASGKRTDVRGENFVRLVFVGGSLGMEVSFQNVWIFGSVEWIWS